MTVMFFVIFILIGLKLMVFGASGPSRKLAPTGKYRPVPEMTAEQQLGAEIKNLTMELRTPLCDLVRKAEEKAQREFFAESIVDLHYDLPDPEKEAVASGILTINETRLEREGYRSLSGQQAKKFDSIMEEIRSIDDRLRAIIKMGSPADSSVEEQLRDRRKTLYAQAESMLDPPRPPVNTYMEYIQGVGYLSSDSLEKLNRMVEIVTKGHPMKYVNAETGMNDYREQVREYKEIMDKVEGDPFQRCIEKSERKMEAAVLSDFSYTAKDLTGCNCFACREYARDYNRSRSAELMPLKVPSKTITRRP